MRIPCGRCLRDRFYRVSRRTGPEAAQTEVDVGGGCDNEIRFHRDSSSSQGSTPLSTAAGCPFQVSSVSPWCMAAGTGKGWQGE